jgi:hypothetical protein
MLNIIIGISGKKQAGKNTIAEFISSYVKSKLNIDAKIISFADDLKQFCIDTLGLSYESCYGTDAEKNAPTNYKWEHVADIFRAKFNNKDLSILTIDSLVTSQLTQRMIKENNLRTGYMTAREIMQVLGTELIRGNFGNIWANATIRKIIKNKITFSLIADNRFPDETEAVLNQRYGYVIRLTRNPFNDSHASETALDNYNWSQHKCFVIDNASMTIEEQSLAVTPIIESILAEYSDIRI